MRLLRGPSMKKALKQLISGLDKIMEEHEEVGDTAVREAMYEAVHKGFIAPEAGFQLPDDFQMFSDDGNRQVKAVLAGFLAHPDVKAAATMLGTAQERLDAFQDLGVESPNGSTYDEYFGHADAP
jgi:hypothetical protein